MSDRDPDIRCPHCGMSLIDPPAAESPERVAIVDGEAVFRGRSVRLTPNQIKIMTLLASGRRVDRTQIYQELYWDLGEAGEPDPKGIDVIMCKLRKKLAPIGLSITVRHSLGWRLTEAAEGAAE